MQATYEMMDVYLCEGVVCRGLEIHGLCYLQGRKIAFVTPFPSDPKFSLLAEKVEQFNPATWMGFKNDVTYKPVKVRLPVDLGNKIEETIKGKTREEVLKVYYALGEYMPARITLG